jgi:hypothetical protein
MGSGEMGSGGETPRCDSPDGARREADLPEDLRDLLDAVRRAAVDIRAAEAEHACRIATLARASAGRHARHGLTATEACARALGVARSTLQAFATLAARWSPEDLRTMFQRRDPRGRALSLSNLLVISRLPRVAREQCIHRIFREGLSVRELRERNGRAGAAANEQEEAVEEIEDHAQVV